MNKEMNRLENLKRDNINSFSSYEWFPEWENFLTLDYWKDWRNKISNFQTKKELNFYTEKLDEIAYSIWKRKKYGEREAKGLFHYHFSPEKHGVMEGMDPDEMIKQEQLRLQNISQDDWKKEYRFANEHLNFQEMSAEEINQSFGEIDEAIYKSEIIKRLDEPVSYRDWTKERLNAEVKELNFLITELRKDDKSLNERQKRGKNSIVQRLERQLSQSKAFLNNNNNNNNPFPILPIVGTVGVVALLGLMVYKLSSKRIKK